MPNEFARKIRRAYLGAIAYMDAQLGKVVNAMEAAGQQNNTIVTFVGDQCVKTKQYRMHASDNRSDCCI